MDYAAIKTAVQKPKKKRLNSKYSERERYFIGKYAAINGATAVVRKFKKSYPHLNFGESWYDIYDINIKKLSRQKEALSK